MTGSLAKSVPGSSGWTLHRPEFSSLHFPELQRESKNNQIKCVQCNKDLDRGSDLEVWQLPKTVVID